MENFIEIAKKNQEAARQIIEDTNVIGIWESIGAKINLIGSLKSGLLMKNKDIDFHIYTDNLTVGNSFKAIEKLAENSGIKHIEYNNLIDTDEECIEWHATYHTPDNIIWKMDMIHIRKGSAYDGYMEKVSDRMIELMTPEIKEAILRIKYETPDDMKILGIEIYQAVYRDGIRNFKDFLKWHDKHSNDGVLNWIP